MRILLTAGFDRAPNVLALADLLRRDGHEVAGILVVSPYSLSRLRGMVRRHGKTIIMRSLRRLFGPCRFAGADDPLTVFLQKQTIEWRSLRRWCAAYQAPYQVVSNLNADEAVATVARLQPEVVIYGGGGILRAPFLNAAQRRVLNAHSGPLPHIRGMNACEWSLLLDIPPAVTIHRIDEGIDTGEIIEVIPLPVEATDSVESLRAKCVVLGIEGLRRAVEAFPSQGDRRVEPAELHRQCFVMAPVLRELLEWKLDNARKQRRQPA